jgi:DNA-directed RNA polymerase specialized sigma24 family protein
VHNLPDLPVPEVARILRCSVAAAKSRLLRARAALRRALARRGVR